MLAYRKSGKKFPTLPPVRACQSLAFLGHLHRTPVGWFDPMSRPYAGAGSGFPLRTTDGELPVQRLKAWLKEAEPS